jgi:two-component system OmpR family sensor kinase
MRYLSLRSRLLIAVGAITLLALTAADVAVYTSLKSYLYTQVDSTLQISHIAVESATNEGTTETSDGENTTSPQGTSTSTNTSPSNSSEFCQVGRESAPGMFIEVRNTTNHVVSGEECPAFFPGEKSYSPLLPNLISGFETSSVNPREPVVYFTVGSSTRGGPNFRVRASKLTNGGVLIVADPIASVASTLRKLLALEFTITGLALVGAILLALWLVRVGLRPLRDVVRTADSISEGGLMSRVPNVNTRTEVGHVSNALNVMLERIEMSFGELQDSENRLRQFVADASHELKTPIAAVSAYAQLFQRGAATRGKDLERVMNGIERETQRMARLVEDLLLIARFDEEQSLELHEVEMVGLAAEAVETARLVGASWPITFIASEPIEVLGDRIALRQVIDNLLANVRAHTPPGTMATVRVMREASSAVVEVADDGPGFSVEQSREIFERFFRTDASRSRETGGAGLGLAIVATIVRAHGGSTTGEPRPTGGAIFRVSIPALDENATSDD